MQKKVVIFMVVLISIPVILSICLSILGGVSSVLQLFVNHPVWLIAFLAFLIITIIGLSLYTIKRNYTPLSPDSKSSFWQILTNIFLVFFTFWMGIFVQDLIASKNEAINKKMVTFEYVDRLNPNYKKLLYSDFVSDLGVYADISNVYSQKLKDDSLKLKSNPIYVDSCRIDNEIKNRCDLQLMNYLIEHKKEIVAQSKMHDSIMADYKYYLNRQMFDSISSMNRTRNFLIAVAELIEDSTKKDSIPRGIILETIAPDDSSAYAKELAYFENVLKSPYMLYSGNPSRDFYKMADLGSQYYQLSKQGDFYQMHILKTLASYLVIDGNIMMAEMYAQRSSSAEPIMSILKVILGGPVQTFIVFLLLTLIASAVVVRIISPRRVKPVVTKEVYDELNKKCDDLNAIIRQKEIELNRKRKECKDADSMVKDLQEQIQERNKKISDLESAIHE